jgi:serine-type D-Ala-D-Ala carboxypeptidase/endopeptidase (penicillin-binding protein 4)
MTASGSHRVPASATGAIAGQRHRRHSERLVESVKSNVFVAASLVAAVAGLTACAPRAALPARAAAPGPAATIDSVLRTPPVHRASWGIAVYDPATSEWLPGQQPHRLFIPASNMKLVVAAVALDVLGPEYRYRTRIAASGLPADSAVARLVVTGSGDPTFSRRFASDDFAAIDSLAAQVAAAGITRAGELVVDASLFDAVPVPGVWEVGDLPGIFAPPVGAFAIGEGTFQLVIRPGAGVGEAGSVEVIGGADLQPLVAAVVTEPAGGRASRSIDYTARRDAVHLSARVPLDARPDTVRLSVTDPAAYAGAALRNALQARGVEVTYGVRVVHDSVEARQLRAATQREVAHRVSPDLIDVVTAILMPSQNWMAEQLLKTLGAVQTGQGSWPSGLAVERRHLIDVVGLDSTSFNLRDASGMAPQNLLAPEANVLLLRYAAGRPWGAAFRSALPRPGLAGATLSGRLQGLESQVSAKTGTISNVATLSGYLVTHSGRELIFSVMTNGTGVAAAPARAAVDQIVEALAGIR